MPLSEGESDHSTIMLRVDRSERFFRRPAADGAARREGAMRHVLSIESDPHSLVRSPPAENEVAPGFRFDTAQPHDSGFQCSKTVDLNRTNS